jgi:cellulose synthase/poly-beta-1,6-N-acetylglucosamine synthase-like glycosyltransferase
MLGGKILGPVVDFMQVSGLIFEPQPIQQHQKSLGEILIEKKKVTSEQLHKALAIQKESGGRLGWILVSLGWISRIDFFQCLAEHYMLPFYRIDKLDSLISLNKSSIKSLSYKKAIQYHALLISNNDRKITILTDYPNNQETIDFFKNKYHVSYVEQLIVTDLDFLKIVKKIYGSIILDDSIQGLLYRNPNESAALVFTKKQVIVLGISLFFILFWFYYHASSLIIIIFTIWQIAFLASVSFKTFLSIIGAFSEKRETISKKEIASLKDEDLPIYTILVPAYNEPKVLPKLMQALKNLNYPPQKLDILLLLEENDLATLEAAKLAKPPGSWKFILVPDSIPKTKPKACNYGVFFSRGKYLTIYDAEDIPEPDQLKKALIAFRKNDSSYLCFQAALNYYNNDENLITRLFTLEYSYWFDYLLPGLNRLKMPIPLGGTSNHFRTDYLKILGAWDPFNVTEDADLGIRACTHSFKVGILDSTTHEEANSNYFNWIRQRSRWIKGYIQTALVFNRAPIRLLKTIGLKNWLGIQLFIAGTPLLFIINPVVWSIFIYWIISQSKLFDQFFPPLLAYIALYNLLFGNFLGIYLNMLSIFKRKIYRLLPYSLLNPFYWLFFHSIASYKAIWQIFTRPFHWEKTKHGISTINKI